MAAVGGPGVGPQGKPPGKAGRREVAAALNDLLAIEIVGVYGRLSEAKQGAVAAGPSIEAIGYRVGFQLAERFSKDRPRFGEYLEAIKFICKEFWSELFNKQVDNLKTNHKGVFVLQDNTFRWLRNVSAEAADSAQPGSAAKDAHTLSDYMLLPCGLIRGGLACLGYTCSVSCDISTVPSCSFTIRMKVS